MFIMFISCSNRAQQVINKREIYFLSTKNRWDTKDREVGNYNIGNDLFLLMKFPIQQQFFDL